MNKIAYQTLFDKKVEILDVEDDNSLQKEQEKNKRKVLSKIKQKELLQKILSVM